MGHTKMRTIPDPEFTRSTIQREGEGSVVFRGPQIGLVYVCGSCGAPVLDGVPGSHVVDLILRCNGCGAFNESPASDVARLVGKAIKGPVMFPVGRYRITKDIDVPETMVMASERSLQATGLGNPVKYHA